MSMQSQQPLMTRGAGAAVRTRTSPAAFDRIPRIGRQAAAPAPPMHLALFVYCLSGGGAQRRTVTLANGFAARGHRVDLVVVSSEQSRGVVLHPEIRLVTLDKGWRRTLEPLKERINMRGLFTAGILPPLVQYLRRERPDVFLSAASHVNLVALLAHQIADAPEPLVLRVSNYPEGNLERWPAVQRNIRRVLGWTARRVYPWADGVIAVSEGVAREVAHLTRIPPEHITTIYNPVVTADVQRAARAPLDHPWFAPGAPPVVLGAGKFKLQKDFPCLLRAFARVRAARPARLVILGEGPDANKLERLARNLGIDADVDFPGFVDNPFAWMSRASVFVLSSAWEGLPGVLIEALACGCPVVSTNCPSGPAEILERGRYGRLVPVGNDRALAEGILATLDRPPNREKLRRRGMMFAVDPAVDRYLEVLRAIAGQRRTLAPAA